MLALLTAAAALSLASVVVNLCTPRARPRINAWLGTSVAGALFAVGVAALMQQLAGVVAVAVALCGLMLGIAVVSVLLAVRNRKRGHHGA